MRCCPALREFSSDPTGNGEFHPHETAHNPHGCCAFRFGRRLAFRPVGCPQPVACVRPEMAFLVLIYVLLRFSFDISPQPLEEGPERFYRSGVPLHQLASSFSCTCKKTEAITPRRDRLQTPVSRFTLRVAAADGARGNSPRLR